MEITVREVATTKNSTGSLMLLDKRPFCMVLEDGYNFPKIHGKTRIPGGRYRVVPRYDGRIFEEYKKRFGHKFAIFVEDVPGFSGIAIHIGNKVSDTDGCQCVNRSLGIDRNGDFFGSDSTSVYLLLYALIEKAFERKEEVWLSVERFDVITEK